MSEIPMSECFAIVISQTLPLEDVKTLLADLLPDVEAFATCGDEVPPSSAEIWLRLEATADSEWPCKLDFWAFPMPSPLGPYPEIAFAEHLFARRGINALCDPNDRGSGLDLDPDDPYWFFACVEGVWYLADAAETALLGPYTDGTRTFPGTEPVKLVKRIELLKESPSHGTLRRKITICVPIVGRPE